MPAIVEYYELRVTYTIMELLVHYYRGLGIEFSDAYENRNVDFMQSVLVIHVAVSGQTASQCRRPMQSTAFEVGFAPL